MCMWTPASNPRGGELFQLTGHSLRSVTKNRISWHEPNAYSAPDPVPNVLQIFDSLNSHNYALVEVTLILFILQSRHTGVQELGQGRGARTGLWPQLVWLLFVFFVCLFASPLPPSTWKFLGQRSNPSCKCELRQILNPLYLGRDQICALAESTPEP